MQMDSTNHSDQTPTVRLENALELLGLDENTKPVHSSNLLHAIEIFSASSGDTALEKSRARADWHAS